MSESIFETMCLCCWVINGFPAASNIVQIVKFHTYSKEIDFGFMSVIVALFIGHFVWDVNVVNPKKTNECAI